MAGDFELSDRRAGNSRLGTSKSKQEEEASHGSQDQRTLANLGKKQVLRVRNLLRFNPTQLIMNSDPLALFLCWYDQLPRRLEI